METQINNNWLTKSLSEVCLIKPPKIEARKRLKADDLVSFVPMEDLGILKKSFDLNKERKLKAVSGSYTYFANDDVLLAKITPCFENGKLGIARNLKNGIGFGSSEYIVFRPNKDLLSDYLFYFLANDNFRQQGKENMSGAVGHKRVSKEFIDSYRIPLPSIKEQHRIVNILDEVFEEIAKAKENAEINLKNAKKLFESYMESVFANHQRDWEGNTLINLTSKIGSGATPRGGKSSYKTEGIFLVRSMNVHDREFREKNLAFIDSKQANDLLNVTLKPNDVLLNITGASVARSCILPARVLPARVNQHVSIIRARQDIIDPIFLNYLLTSKYYKDQLLGIGEQGATRQAITKAQLEHFKIFFPKSLAEQKNIVTRLDTLSAETKKLEALYKQKLSDLEELRKSVLNKAFSGEL